MRYTTVFTVLGVFVAFIFYYCIEEGIEIYKHKWKYFTEFWNLLDVAVLTVSCRVTCD